MSSCLNAHFNSQFDKLTEPVEVCLSNWPVEVSLSSHHLTQPIPNNQNEKIYHI